MNFDNIETGRWHDRNSTTPQRLQQLYGTPRSWYRRSVHLAKATADDLERGAREEKFIRVAAIFSRNTDISELTGLWSMIIWPRQGITCSIQKDWVMIIASPADISAWLYKAWHLGARAWYRNDDTAPVWFFQPVEHITDPEADTRPRVYKRTKSTGVHGGYDREGLIDDIRAGYLTQAAIAEKHKVSRTTVNNIARAMKMSAAPAPPRKTRIQQQIDGIDQQAVIEDLKSNRMTKGQIARKYAVDVYAITRIQTAAGLLGKVNAHKALARGRGGGRPQQYIYDEAAVVRDIEQAKENGWTRDDVAEKHNIKTSTLTGIQNKYNLRGRFARGFAAKPCPRKPGTGVGVAYNKKAP